MKKLFLNLALFIIPILILFFAKKACYKTSGDLGRMSKTIIKKDYRLKFKSDFNKTQKFKLLTEIQKSKNENKTRILIIGDSFSSGQGNFGFVNQLAEMKDLEVVLYQNLLRKKIEENPISALAGLINGGCFEAYDFDYVILQNVERYFLGRTHAEIDNFFIHLDSIKNKIKKPLLPLIIPSKSLQQRVTKRITNEFNDFILFYQYNYSYAFNNRASDSDVYKFALTRNAFAYGDDLLVYYEDLDKNKISPDIKNLNHSRKTINKLAEKLAKLNIQFISVIAPDKYDVYHPLIKNRENYPEPKFFKLYNSMSKDYTDLNCYKILTNAISKNVKDVYFYDDTHWSPIAHSIIAKALHTLITKKNITKQTFKHVEKDLKLIN